MPRGATLQQLVTKLKNELRLAQSDALSTNVLPALRHSLATTQRRLYDEYDWPFLRVRKETPLAAGQRFYDMPAGISIEQIETVHVKFGETWLPLARGIGPEHYSEHNSIATAATANLTVSAGALASAVGNFTVTNGTADANSTISNITVNGLALITANVSWTSSNAYTAQLAAAAINARSATTNITANVSNATVNVIGDANLGATSNGYPLVVTANGNVTVGSVSNLTGGANNLISALTIDDVNVIEHAVGWRTSNQATAAALAATITAAMTTPGYTAEASGDTVTISASESEGADANNLAVNVTTAGNLTVSAMSNMTGGVSAERSDPPVLFDIVDGGNGPQIEVWPVPASDAMRLMVIGKGDLPPLVDDDDVAVLDDDAIVFFAAAEEMAMQGKKGAELTLRKAQARLAKVRGRIAGGRTTWGTGYREPGKERFERVRVAYVRNPS